MIVQIKLAKNDLKDKFNCYKMDDIFQNVNFTGFNDETIKEIKEDFIRFSKFFKLESGDYEKTSVTIS